MSTKLARWVDFLVLASKQGATGKATSVDGRSVQATNREIGWRSSHGQQSETGVIGDDGYELIQEQTSKGSSPGNAWLKELWWEKGCAVCGSVKPEGTTNVETPFFMRLQGPAEVFASAVPAQQQMTQVHRWKCHSSGMIWRSLSCSS